MHKSIFKGTLYSRSSTYTYTNCTWVCKIGTCL